MHSPPDPTGQFVRWVAVNGILAPLPMYVNEIMENLHPGSRLPETHIVVDLMFLVITLIGTTEIDSAYHEFGSVIVSVIRTFFILGLIGATIFLTESMVAEWPGAHYAGPATDRLLHLSWDLVWAVVFITTLIQLATCLYSIFGE